MKKIIIRLFITGLTIVMLAVTAFFVSPVPTGMYIRKLFASNPFATKPDDYEKQAALVKSEKDLQYPSKYKDNTYDLYLPKEKTGKIPLIFWVHGGAYVGGDKVDVEVYATLLASKGYAVLAMNYERAPEAKYPTPIIQTSEMYAYLPEIVKMHPEVNAEAIFFAGDSAGAQIVAQFVNIQLNKDLATKMGMQQLVPKNVMKGALLYCGPYDLKSLNQTNHPLLEFFLKRLGWSYLGEKDWKTSNKLAEIDVVKNITADFPPSFVTDGNNGSFDESGKNLVAALKAKNVPVTAKFFDDKNAKLGHEYQFKMDTVSAQETFEQTLTFLSENK